MRPNNCRVYSMQTYHFVLKQYMYGFISSRRLIFGLPVIALGLAGKSLSAVK